MLLIILLYRVFKKKFNKIGFNNICEYCKKLSTFGYKDDIPNIYSSLNIYCFSSTDIVLATYLVIFNYYLTANDSVSF